MQEDEIRCLELQDFALPMVGKYARQKHGWNSRKNHHISQTSVCTPLHSLNIYKMHVENTFPLPTITDLHLTSFSHMLAVISAGSFHLSR